MGLNQVLPNEESVQSQGINNQPKKSGNERRSNNSGPRQPKEPSNTASLGGTGGQKPGDILAALSEPQPAQT